MQGDVLSDLYDDYLSDLANEEAYADEGRQVVGLSDVFLDREGGTATGTGHLLAAVTATGVAQDSTGESTVTRSSESVGASIRMPVTFELTDGRPSSALVETGEGVVARPNPDGYLAAEDAFQELVECLSCIPGAGDFDWDEPTDGEERRLRLASGVISLTFEGSVFDEWTVTARDSGSLDASVSCSFLNDGYSDDEGFEIESHYSLRTDVDVGFARLNPVWGLNEAILGPPDYDWFAAQDPHG